MNNPTIKVWLENLKKGLYNSNDVNTQIDVGWYDWFCSDEALAGKTKKLAPKIKRIADLLGVEFQNKNYVFFKNNCPMDGSLYDDFRFCDMKTGDVVYTITPALGYNSRKGISEVWGKENKFEKALVSGTWQDVIEYFESKVK